MTTIDVILDAVSGSPLPRETQDRVLAQLRSREGDILSSYSSLQHSPPEQREQKVAAVIEAVFKVITPVLREHGVSEPLGRDVCRDIYGALGGYNIPSYETPEGSFGARVRHVKIERGEGIFGMRDETGHYQERPLEWTVFTLDDHYVPPEGTQIPAGTKSVVVYNFTDDQGGQQVSFSEWDRSGRTPPEACLEIKLRELLAAVAERGESHTKNILYTDGTTRTYKKGQEVNVPKLLGIAK